LWRRKEAFSDGVSGHGRSLFQILQEYTDPVVGNYYENVCVHNKPTTSEQYYYRRIFDSIYPKQSHLVPYFWMPKYVNANDASARTLALYKD